MRGVGLILPFQRDGRGSFATGRDSELWGSAIAMILMTDGDTPQTVGELPWRTSFGAGLARFRFKKLNRATVGAARSDVVNTLQRWMPEVEVLNVDPNRNNQEQRMTLAITWRWRDDSLQAIQRVTIPV